MNGTRALHLLTQLIATVSSSSRRCIPRLILFDIDGTLIRSEHRSDTVPIVKATAEAFKNCNIQRNGVQFSGKTDRGIIRELLTANNVQYDPDTVEETLRILPRVMSDAVDRRDDVYRPLLNAVKVLDALTERRSTDVVCGLLTGNIHQNVDTVPSHLVWAKMVLF